MLIDIMMAIFTVNLEVLVHRKNAPLLSLEKLIKFTKRECTLVLESKVIMR